MPIYEYQCKKCFCKFELLRKINDNSQCICPNCNSDELLKLVSTTSFQLKGTGWYETDYKKKNIDLKSSELKQVDTKKNKDIKNNVKSITSKK